MASEKQPSSLSSRPTTHGDIEEEVPRTTAKSAEDRKAASALASLDDDADPASAPGSSNNAAVDQEALSKAMRAGSSATSSSAASASAAAAAAAQKQTLARNVKIDQADVALLVDELELTKQRATEMLRAGGGDVNKVLREFVTA